eukprot:TRINITY_DN979_c4_g1_i1.p1 TRINITY_DN979_c4_g1~~TRINITY_DN979_c4_g1_i1.p1  ORF type:complete len:286 (+),score=87.65 TRINITY_DN979_c4_g1_i1:126-983(+)
MPSRDQTRAFCFCLTRARPEQNLTLPIFVSVMMAIYVFLATLVMLPATEATPEWRWRHSLIAVCDAAMVLYCLWVCTLRDPGRVPEGWKPPSPTEAGMEQVCLESSYCKRCEEYKMPRTHHCSQCRRCVLRFDHHCDWIDNCVGQYTHKLFVLFLFYVTGACLHYFYVLASQVLFGAHIPGSTSLRKLKSAYELLYLLGVTTFSIIAFVLLLFAGTFLYVTVTQLLYNQTTMEADFVPGTPYHKSFLRNVQDVMGSSPLIWFVPYVPEPLPLTENVPRQMAFDFV